MEKLEKLLRLIIFSGLGLRGCVSRAEINKFEGDESIDGILLYGLVLKEVHIPEAIN